MQPSDSVPPADQQPSLGPSEIARHWTANGWPSSRQLADRYIRIGVRGSKCPTTSLEAALAWRQTHTRARTAQKTAAKTTTTTSLKNQSGPANRTTPTARTRPPPVAPSDDSLESSLARARAMEAEQYQLWIESLTATDTAEQSLRIRAHRDALNARMDAEKRVVEHLQAVGQLVSLPAAQDVISQRLSSLRAARASLSRTLALELFPDAPQRAQPRIEAALVTILDPAVVTAAQPLITVDVPESAPPASP